MSGKNAIELNQLWRASRNTQILPDAVDTIKSLGARGYKLSIISNTTSSLEAPQMLKENGIYEYFEVVILSCVFGRRKPHPSSFLSAAQIMGIAPERCAYIGDNPSLDLVGAKQAGYGEVVIISLNGLLEDEYDPDDDFQSATIMEMKPNHKIENLQKLLKIYPDRNKD